MVRVAEGYPILSNAQFGKTGGGKMRGYDGSSVWVA